MTVRIIKLPSSASSVRVAGYATENFRATTWRGNDLLVQLKNGDVLIFKEANHQRLAAQNFSLVFDDATVPLAIFSPNAVQPGPQKTPPLDAFFPPKVKKPLTGAGNTKAREVDDILGRDDSWADQALVVAQAAEPTNPTTPAFAALSQPAASPDEKPTAAPAETGISKATLGWAALGVSIAALPVGGGGAVATDLGNIGGLVMLGPVVAGNDLFAYLYDAKGNLLGSAKVNADGSFNVKLTRASSTAALILEVRGTDPNPDYANEATRVVEAFNGVIKTVLSSAGGAGQEAQVNHLTDLLARVLTNETHKAWLETSTAAQLRSVSLAVAKAQGLSDGSVPLEQIRPVATVEVNAAGEVVKTDAANLAGQFLEQAARLIAADTGKDAFENVQKALASNLNLILPTPGAGDVQVSMMAGGDLSKALLTAKVADYAQTKNPSNAPKLSDYALAGFSTVTRENVDMVNAAATKAVQTAGSGSHPSASLIDALTEAANRVISNPSPSTTNLNQAPIGVDKTIALLEDESYSFSQTDFGFVDAMGEGHALKNVIITGLPTAGTLQLSEGSVVRVGQSVLTADLPMLQFIPVPNQYGGSYDRLRFKLQDNGGVANGGVDTSSEHTLTFDVTAVNDAPTAVGTVPVQTGVAKTPFVTLDLSAAFADVDAVDTRTYSVSAGTLPAGLSLNASNGQITGTPTAATNGTVQVTITLTDSGLLTAQQQVDFTISAAAASVVQPAVLPSWITAAGYVVDTTNLSVNDPRMGLASLISNDALDPSLAAAQSQASWLAMNQGGTSRLTATSADAPLQLSYAFQDAGARYEDTNGVEHVVQPGMSYTATERSFVASVLANFASFANVVFNPSNSQSYVGNGGADLRLFKGTTAEYGVSASTLGFAIQPAQITPKSLDAVGNLFLVTDAQAYPQNNAFGFAYGHEKTTVSHELGHAMGLDHPFKDGNLALSGWYGDHSAAHQGLNNLGLSSGGSYDTPLTDTPQESLMGYYAPFDAVQGVSNALLPGKSEVFTPWKAGLYDMAALQHLYGANMGYNTGADVYSYDSSTPVFDTIWDAGGNDTLEQQGSQAAVIDLRGGEHMSRMGLFSGAKYVFSQAVLEADLKNAYQGSDSVTIKSLRAVYIDNSTEHVVGLLTKTGSEWTYLTDPSMPAGLDVKLVATYDVYAFNTINRADQEQTIARLPDIGVADPSMAYNVGIAFGVVIENAVGGSGNDTIWGNVAANQISTGAGADTVKYDSAISINGDTIIDFSSLDRLDLSALHLNSAQQAQVQWSASTHQLSYTDTVNSANTWVLNINTSLDKTTQVIYA